jgi:hypothetical protein
MARVTVSSVLASALSAEVEVVSSISVEAINVVVERVLVQTAVAAGYATATVSRVIPEALVEYVLADATAFLDELQRWKKFRETVGASDIAAISVNKAFTDSVGTDDSAAVDASKSLSDSVSVTETLVVTIIFIRNFADSVTTTDSIQFINTVKKLTDNVATTESTVKDFSKALADQATLTDAAALLMSKPLTDSVSHYDDSFWAFAKALADGVDASDALNNIVFDKVLSDSASITEAKAIDVSKPLTDAVIPSDFFTRTVQYSRSFTDTATVTEALSNSFGKSLQDSAAPSDNSAWYFYKAASDSVTVTDSIISIVIVSGATQLINSFPLNVFTLNGP